MSSPRYISITPSSRSFALFIGSQVLRISQSLYNSRILLTIPPVQEIGISELYVPPQDVEPVADVIFVHGLMGHPVKTWLHGEIPDTAAIKPQVEQKDKHKSILSSIRHRIRSKDRHEVYKEGSPYSVDSFCYWPFHLLRRDIKDIRILTYGYESSPTHWYMHKTNQMTITQHAEDLLFKVSMKRSECKGRPLIFVAHSLGGILVKSALNESRQMQYQPLQADVLKCCHAIIFFGTPHLGASIASWGELISNIVGALPGSVSTYGEVLRGLSPDSETLYNVTKRFNELLNEPIPPKEKIQICSIQEGKGKLGIKGGGSKAVPDYSSKLNRSDIEQGFFIQDGNHMDMCRFSSAQTSGYSDFVSVLKSYQHAILEKKAIFQEGQVESSVSDAAELLKALNFADRLDREHQLTSLYTTDESFEWIWSSDFVPWLQSEKPLFWIVGHPASGKSTLTHYLSRNTKIKQILKDHFKRDVLIVRFFFDYRANDDIRNTFSGVERSLLHQILYHSPSVTSAVERKFQLKEKNGYEWLGDDSQLTEILLYSLSSLNSRTLLFLDGLDEYKGEKPELIDLIDRMLSTDIKICLASRDEHIFRLRLRNEPFIRMDIVNRPGIEAYASKFLTSSLRPDQELEHRWIQNCSNKIAIKSNGVFLWARFAVLEIIDRRGEEIIYSGHEEQVFENEAIEKILYQLPGDLKQLYHRVFSNKDEKDKTAYGIILQLITTAKRKLRLSELYEACVAAKAYPAPTSAKVRQIELAGFRRYIHIPGLLQSQSSRFSVVKSGRKTSFHKIRLTVIHRTVQTYLEEQGWILLLGEDRATQPRHLIWLEILPQVLQGPSLNWKYEIQAHGMGDTESYDSDPNDSDYTDKSDDSDISYDSPIDEYPAKWRIEQRHEDELRFLEYLPQGLLQYAEVFMPKHAHDFEKESRISSQKLIGGVLTSSFLQAHVDRIVRKDTRSFKRDSILKTHVIASSLHFAVFYRLSCFVEEQIRNSSIDPRLLETNEASLMYFLELMVNKEKSSLKYRRALCAPRFSLLELALMLIGLESTPARSRSVEMLAGISPRIGDDFMLIAITCADLIGLRELLREFPTGKLRLRSKFFPAGVGNTPRADQSGPLVEFGPLSGVAPRALADIKSAIKVLGIFLERGEDIDSQCCPFGTVLHSLIAHICHMEVWSDDDFERIEPAFNTFIEHGADVRVEGPHGNILELLWMFIDQKEKGKRYGHRERACFGRVMRLLASKGLENRREDKNGKITTVEEMIDTMLSYSDSSSYCTNEE